MFRQYSVANNNNKKRSIYREKKPTSIKDEIRPSIWLLVFFFFFVLSICLCQCCSTRPKRKCERKKGGAGVKGHERHFTPYGNAVPQALCHSLSLFYVISYDLCDVVVCCFISWEISQSERRKRKGKKRRERWGKWGETNNALLLSVDLPPS